MFWDTGTKFSCPAMLKSFSRGSPRGPPRGPPTPGQQMFRPLPPGYGARSPSPSPPYSPQMGHPPRRRGPPPGHHPRFRGARYRGGGPGGGVRPGYPGGLHPSQSSSSVISLGAQQGPFRYDVCKLLSLFEPPLTHCLQLASLALLIEVTSVLRLQTSYMNGSTVAPPTSSGGEDPACVALLVFRDGGARR